MVQKMSPGLTPSVVSQYGIEDITWSHSQCCQSIWYRRCHLVSLLVFKRSIWFIICHLASLLVFRRSIWYRRCHLVSHLVFKRSIWYRRCHMTSLLVLSVNMVQNMSPGLTPSVCSRYGIEDVTWPHSQCLGVYVIEAFVLFLYIYQDHLFNPIFLEVLCLSTSFVVEIACLH